MKYLFIFLFSVIFVHVNAGVYLIPPDPKSAHLGHCYTDHLNIGSMNKGETRRIDGQCSEAYCGTNSFIQVLGCGTVSIGYPCKKLVGDLSKPYPQCCYEIECPKIKPKLVNGDGLFPKSTLEEAELKNNEPKIDDDLVELTNTL